MSPREKYQKPHVVEHLEALGYQVSVASIKLLPLLYGELERRFNEGSISSDLLIEGYLSGLAVSQPEIPGWVRSLIVISMAQPIGRFRFEVAGGFCWGIVPPQYKENQDDEVEEALKGVLSGGGFRLGKARIPLKLAAVRSGLAEYGRNNLTYTKANGSFHRLAAFFSDLPCEETEWEDSRIMNCCSGCNSCVRNCPTGCIGSHHFMVKAERCLTFHSESRKPLPGWIDKKWTNAIIGCMRCQSICPANREVLSRIETWETFSMEETESFAAARGAEEIPPRVASKLKSLGLGGYLDVMGRNLGLLLNRR